MPLDNAVAADFRHGTRAVAVHEEAIQASPKIQPAVTSPTALSPRADGGPG
jgi:hypothetical protein